MNAQLKSGKKSVLVYAFVSFFFVFILGFIDEGNYNFRWMLDPGSWVALAVYALAIFAGMLLVSQVFLKRFSGMGKVLLSILGGVLIGIIFVVTLIFTN